MLLYLAGYISLQFGYSKTNQTKRPMLSAFSISSKMKTLFNIVLKCLSKEDETLHTCKHSTGMYLLVSR